MGAVVAVASVIASAVASAAAAVASAVMAVVSAVTAAIGSIAGAIYGTVSAVVSSVAGAIGAVAGKIYAGVSSIVSGISAVVGPIASQMAYYAKMLYGYMQYLARIIHLKTIIQIHQIAYIVSEDYRQMMDKIYSKLAEVSEELGLGAQFLNLALQNARSVILDISAMMGKSYDLAEITWLKSFTSFMKKFEDKVMNYQNNPEEVFADIDRWLLKDTVDAGSDVQKTLFTILEKTTEVLHETVQDVVKVRNDLDQFVSDLPEEIRDEIEPYVDPVIDKVDGFLEDEYAPFKQTMDDIIDVLDNKQTTVKNRVDGIVDRLTRPGDLLKGVDSLPIDQRINQENKISDVAARSNQRQADNLQAQAAPTWEHLEKLRRALEEAPPPPEYVVVERKKPIVPAGEQSKEADTWFVGDY